MMRAALLLPLMMLTACGATNAPFATFEAPSLSPPRPGDPRTNPAVSQACREQVSAETRRQERGNMMREDDRGSLTAAPFWARAPSAPPSGWASNSSSTGG